MACFPLSSSSPTGKEGGLFHTARDAARIKKPQPGTVGVGTHAAAPFPRKGVSAPCRAGLLARGMSLLSAPSQGSLPQWSLQISCRSQLRGSDGFAPSSLVTVSTCAQPYQRHIRFCVLAYGRALKFVKDLRCGKVDRGTLWCLRAYRNHAILSTPGGGPWIASSCGHAMVRRCGRPSNWARLLISRRLVKS